MNESAGGLFMLRALRSALIVKDSQMQIFFGHRLSAIRELMCVAFFVPTVLVMSMSVSLAAPAETAATSRPSAPVQEISPAEVMLFQTDHLKNIRMPVDLTYAYRKVNESGSAVDDQIHVDVTKINPDGSSTVSLRFLTGTRKLEIPKVENSRGNPLLLGFLESDIGQMKQETGGSTNYFRKRIRMALADTAQVRPITFMYHGKKLDGQEISVQPYRNDPMHARFEKYVNKRYVFILSSQIAGGVYQIGSSLSGVLTDVSTQRKVGQMEESITLVKEEKSKR
ncbi:hypothetical protein RGU75_05575 [Glaciimonas sp. CA11.2]|uniref:hypothetical protein n=1 Tax=Glaciimonas sp. CA11.2 TaxID=3048601 RepID=UPI002AB5D200|nr:hypothetical protein [Glaciimonas sp. CA11.2]MDY7545702.1 hypothetical protein [Glaciimonas sp. CA11.2]